MGNSCLIWACTRGRLLIGKWLSFTFVTDSSSAWQLANGTQSCDATHHVCHDRNKFCFLILSIPIILSVKSQAAFVSDFYWDCSVKQIQCHEPPPLAPPPWMCGHFLSTHPQLVRHPYLKSIWPRWVFQILLPLNQARRFEEKVPTQSIC